jgi:hypothetical protein
MNVAYLHSIGTDIEQDLLSSLQDADQLVEDSTRTVQSAIMAQQQQNLAANQYASAVNGNMANTHSQHSVHGGGSGGLPSNGAGGPVNTGANAGQAADHPVYQEVDQIVCQVVDQVAGQVVDQVEGLVVDITVDQVVGLVVDPTVDLVEDQVVDLTVDLVEDQVIQEMGLAYQLWMTKMDGWQC